MENSGKFGVCALCGCERGLTFHHLIPRKLHRRTFFQKNYSKDELNRGIDVCRLCHKGIHKYYDEMTLAREYADLDALVADERLARHYAWSAKQKSAGKK